jgi:hypothetical protein
MLQDLAPFYFIKQWSYHAPNQQCLWEVCMKKRKEYVYVHLLLELLPILFYHTGRKLNWFACSPHADLEPDWMSLEKWIQGKLQLTIITEEAHNMCISTFLFVLLIFFGKAHFVQSILWMLVLELLKGLFNVYIFLSLAWGLWLSWCSVPGVIRAPWT